MRRRMSLSREQLETLQAFQEISQIHDEHLAQQVLMAHDWNLELSLSQFMSEDDIQSAQAPPVRAAATTTPLTTAVPTDNTRVPHEPRATSLVESEDVNGFVNLLFYPIRWLFKPESTAINPSRDAQRFIADFASSYGTRGPRFHDNSYQSAVNLAFQESKFLLVYLHSPMHEDTDSFCEQVLCSPTFVQYANENVIIWGGSIFNAEAYGLSTQLSVSSFPFLALLLCQSSRVAQIASRIQGVETVANVIERLHQLMESHTAVLNRNRMETERRREGQRLREQQDREYQESLEAERREMERREREIRERAEAEERRRQEEERAAAEALSAQRSRQNEIQRLKVEFDSIPEPDKTPDAATIRFQLPRNAKLERRFLKTETMQRVQTFLQLHFAAEGDITTRFSICTNYPKVEISDFSKTIQEMSLHPRGMLFVQDLDA